MIDACLSQIAETIGGNLWLAPILALIAGVLTSVTPCSLSSIPLIIGYVGGIGEKNTKKAFAYSVVFSIGSAITFVTLGIIATSAGKLMGTSSPIWYGILGTLMVLMALQTFGIINIIPSTNLLSKNKKRGFIGAFLAGILAGIFSSPCSTPVLIALLAIVAGKGNIFWGILLMLLYSIGHSSLVMVAGTSVGFVQRIKSSEKYRNTANILKIIMGIAILLIGFYMFYLAF
ncbi:cytochrome c biogenesis CcdA family protein [Ohessyouella blattaphilus]|uniref:Sulfite exporter TauE/SafE family protein n=1 Tax=Ohessyouella blattaphilus TaxID=2949333 RepID=A0ABT1EI97_9FIRM|nr:cytochrome c biogenesis protein CcdA [Ohessyouella blattaphilus]MCP1110424.1 sulfite exporter TauE/SafE family protein [Ohessyouella blattaphilus]MCR8563818.1 sulfite exporter TauE/SafE family protein [Ohessyouella blattaphilus]MDL2249996.1 sulfite exporter TauE/SafE family protein [Lachnospiraceae bacterium OttesenSCG-928-J05]